MQYIHVSLSCRNLDLLCIFKNDGMMEVFRFQTKYDGIILNRKKKFM